MSNLINNSASASSSPWVSSGPRSFIPKSKSRIVRKRLNIYSTYGRKNIRRLCRIFPSVPIYLLKEIYASHHSMSQAIDVVFSLEDIIRQRLHKLNMNRKDSVLPRFNSVFKTETANNNTMVDVYNSRDGYGGEEYRPLIDYILRNNGNNFEANNNGEQSVSGNLNLVDNTSDSNDTILETQSDNFVHRSESLYTHGDDTVENTPIFSEMQIDVEGDMPSLADDQSSPQSEDNYNETLSEENDTTDNNETDLDNFSKAKENSIENESSISQFGFGGYRLVSSTCSDMQNEENAATADDLNNNVMNVGTENMITEDTTDQNNVTESNMQEKPSEIITMNYVRVKKVSKNTFVFVDKGFNEKFKTQSNNNSENGNSCTVNEENNNSTINQDLVNNNEVINENNNTSTTKDMKVLSANNLITNNNINIAVNINNIMTKDIISNVDNGLNEKSNKNNKSQRTNGKIKNCSTILGHSKDVLPRFNLKCNVSDDEIEKKIPSYTIDSNGIVENRNVEPACVNDESKTDSNLNIAPSSTKEIPPMNLNKSQEMSTSDQIVKTKLDSPSQFSIPTKQIASSTRKISTTNQICSQTQRVITNDKITSTPTMVISNHKCIVTTNQKASSAPTMLQANQKVCSSTLCITTTNQIASTATTMSQANQKVGSPAQCIITTNQIASSAPTLSQANQKVGSSTQCITTTNQIATSAPTMSTTNQKIGSSTQCITTTQQIASAPTMSLAKQKIGSSTSTMAPSNPVQCNIPTNPRASSVSIMSSTNQKERFSLKCKIPTSRLKSLLMSPIVQKASSLLPCLIPTNDTTSTHIMSPTNQRAGSTPQCIIPTNHIASSTPTMSPTNQRAGSTPQCIIPTNHIASASQIMSPTNQRAGPTSQCIIPTNHIASSSQIMSANNQNVGFPLQSIPTNGIISPISPLDQKVGSFSPYIIPTNQTTPIMSPTNHRVGSTSQYINPTNQNGPTQKMFGRNAFYETMHSNNLGRSPNDWLEVIQKTGSPIQFLPVNHTSLMSPTNQIHHSTSEMMSLNNLARQSEAQVMSQNTNSLLMMSNQITATSTQWMSNNNQMGDCTSQMMSRSNLARENSQIMSSVNHQMGSLLRNQHSTDQIRISSTQMVHALNMKESGIPLAYPTNQTASTFPTISPNSTPSEIKYIINNITVTPYQTLYQIPAYAHEMFTNQKMDGSNQITSTNQIPTTTQDTRAIGVTSTPVKMITNQISACQQMAASTNQMQAPTQGLVQREEPKQGSKKRRKIHDLFCGVYDDCTCSQNPRKDKRINLNLHLRRSPDSNELHVEELNVEGKDSKFQKYDKRRDDTNVNHHKGSERVIVEKIPSFPTCDITQKFNKENGDAIKNWLVTTPVRIDQTSGHAESSVPRTTETNDADNVPSTSQTVKAKINTQNMTGKYPSIDVDAQEDNSTDSDIEVIQVSSKANPGKTIIVPINRNSKGEKIDIHVENSSKTTDIELLIGVVKKKSALKMMEKHTKRHRTIVNPKLKTIVKKNSKIKILFVKDSKNEYKSVIV